MTDLLGHVFYVLLIVGTVRLGRRKMDGWLFRIAGESGWAYLGIEMGMSSIVVWSLIFAAADTFAYLRWKKEPPTGSGT